MAEKLSDQQELLFRQIHPALLDGDVPSSSAFKPRKVDESKLSVDRSSLTSAEASFLLFQSNGAKSVAVYALSVGEFEGERIPCFSAPVEVSATQIANPAHCLADFSEHNGSQQDRIAKRLKQKAIARGRQYP